MTSIVFISSGADVVGTIVAARTDQLGRNVTIVVADGMGNRTIDGVAVIDVGVYSRSRLVDRLERSVWGRTLIRVSLADGGVQLRRRIRQSPDAHSAVSVADVVVACTRDAIYAAWNAGHNNPGVLALNGLGAGLAELRRR